MEYEASPRWRAARDSNSAANTRRSSALRSWSRDAARNTSQISTGSRQAPIQRNPAARSARLSAPQGKNRNGLPVSTSREAIPTAK